MAYGSANITNNVAECGGIVHGHRQAKDSAYSPLHVVDTVRLCFRDFGRATIHASNTWRCYFERQEYLLTISVYPDGDITVAHIINGGLAGKYCY